MVALTADQSLFALTFAWTGARVSEVLALMPSSFQVEAVLVEIRTLKRRRHHVREVPLSPDLMIALDRHFGLASIGTIRSARIIAFGRGTGPPRGGSSSA
jgi:integrase/recombinase XerD